MGGLRWIAEHGFEAFQTFGVVASLLLTCLTIHREDKSRRISNLIAINDRYDGIWGNLYTRPGLSRILESELNLKANPVSEEEWLFTKTLFMHLDMVRQAMDAGMFVEVTGIKNDVHDFMQLPIPQLVWQKLKSYQDGEFIAFMDECMRE